MTQGTKRLREFRIGHRNWRYKKEVMDGVTHPVLPSYLQPQIRSLNRKVDVFC